MFRRIRRALLLRKPIDSESSAVVSALPLWKALTESEKTRLLRDVRILVHEKNWQGVGMALSMEHKVTIAAYAARIVLYRGIDEYRDLHSIYVFPSSISERNADSSGRFLGMANNLGQVLLSWAAVKKGIRKSNDGHCVTTHEFAHVLDAADGSFDGTPVLNRGAYAPWARVMSEHFLQLRAASRKKRVIDEYGATNEAEFFAVATEFYFEKPNSLKKRAPELFLALDSYYKQKST